jgi:protein CpxP
MNMDNSKFLKIIIAILVLLNIGTQTFIWTSHHHGMPPPHQMGRGDAGRFLVHELKMTDEQQKQFEELRNEHHNKVEDIRERGRTLHEHFFDLLQNPSTDASNVQQAADSIAANQKQIELVTFEHFRKVRAICTPEQQKRFDEVIDEALQMLDPRPPGPQPGR